MRVRMLRYKAHNLVTLSLKPIAPLTLNGAWVSDGLNLMPGIISCSGIAVQCWHGRQKR